ncbi:MAG: hypothetical protein ACOYU2_06120 [Nitrospirota bacterium]
MTSLKELFSEIEAERANSRSFKIKTNAIAVLALLFMQGATLLMLDEIMVSAIVILALVVCITLIFSLNKE